MIAILLFPAVAAALVYLAGRKDASRDPRLSILLLVLLIVFPLMSVYLPKLELLPATAVAPNESHFPWQKLLLGVWTVGAFVGISRLVLAARGLQRWERCSVLIGHCENVEIRQLENLRGPVAAGIFRPVIYVPLSWQALSEDSRQMVLAHEMAHHRRHDPLWRFLTQTACAIHWYQPLVHWIARRFSEQCEYACDAAVLEKGITPSSYARVLCDFAERRHFSGPALAMAEASTLEMRVRRLITPSQKGSVWVVGLLVSVGFTSAVALALIGRQATEPHVPMREVQLRLSANPFPGN